LNERRVGKIHRLLVTGADNGDTLTAIETFAVQHASAFRHVHTHEDEFVYVLEGNVLFERGGELIDLAPGDCLFLPRAVEHSYRVESAEARLLTIATPAGVEGYVREMEEAQRSTEHLQDIERVIIIAARHGISVTGPAVSSRSLKNERSYEGTNSE
jgi:quercetin dioxygenase-like cupin family protein